MPGYANVNEEKVYEHITGVLLAVAVLVATLVTITNIYPFIASQELFAAITPITYIDAVFASVAAMAILLFVIFFALSFLDEIERPTLFNHDGFTIIGTTGLVCLVVTIILIATGYITASTSSLTSAENTVGLLSLTGLLTVVYGHLSRDEVSRIQPRAETPHKQTTEKAHENYERAYSPDNTLDYTDYRLTGTEQRQTDNRENTDEEEENKTNLQESEQTTEFGETEFRWQTDTDVSFEDVGGMQDLKKQLKEEVLVPIKKKPELAEELGITAPNIVFHGPPGTGKTFMAKALAAELGLPFAKLSGADLQSKWINESAEKVNTLFTEAIQVADQAGGAVVFLDELDSVLKDRTGGTNTHEEDMKVVNEFLNHLENINEHNIVFIGATNRLEALDEAGIRSGRIDKKIKIGKPDKQARTKILRAQLADKPDGTTSETREQIAAMMEGMVASDIELIVKQAARDVLMGDTEKITADNLKKAIEHIESK